MDREDYYKKIGWHKSPFIKSTSIEIPIVSRTEEFREVQECIGGWDRIMVITAPIGYGKTTFMNQLSIQKPKGVKYVISFNSYESPDEAMNKIINSFGILKRMGFRGVTKSEFGIVLEKKLKNDKMLLIFDEAQDYDEDLFKWLRILNDRCNNLFMIFIGLKDLEDKISSEASFRDRKSKTVRLRELKTEDLVDLVKARIEWVGGNPPKPFTEGGLRRLCESSNHVPRLLLDKGQKVIENAAYLEEFMIDEILVEKTLGMEKPRKEGETVDLGDTEEITEPLKQEEIVGEDVSEEVEEAIAEKEPGPYSEPDEPEPYSGEEEPESSESADYVEYYDFMADLSPTQQEIVKMLLTHESLSVSELSRDLDKDIRSIGSLIRKLRGLNKSEVARKPNVPYPVIVRKGKEERMGRSQYVYELSDNARRLLSGR